MKALLDEQLDIRLKDFLENLPLRVFSPGDMGWLGLKNGQLRDALNQNGFRFLITADKNLPFQQNLRRVEFSIVMLDLPSLSWKNQQPFGQKLATFFASPPEQIPLIVHVGAANFGSQQKRFALINLVGVERVLFI